MILPVPNNTVSRLATYECRSTDRSGTEGFYGDLANQHEGVGASYALRLINSCHKWMNHVIKSDEDLSGTVEACRCRRTKRWISMTMSMKERKRNRYLTQTKKTVEKKTTRAMGNDVNTD
jgi:hypothetical protein